ncbi:MAG: hypothetical protein ACYCY9_09445 [Thiobacillus sp.]
MKMKMVTSMRMLIGIALISGFSTTSYAQFNLNKLKSFVEQAKALQERVNQDGGPVTELPAGHSSTNEKSNVGYANDEVSLFNAEAKKVATLYDVAGIKTGMAIAEARAVVKSKTHLKKYREDSATLVFNTVDGQKTLAKFIKGINAQSDNFRKSGGDREELLIGLSPEPGHERIVGVTRRLLFAKENRPRPDDYKKAFIEKYGQPVRSELAGDRLIWFFDHYGNSVPLTNTKTMFQGPGRGCHVPSSESDGARVDVTPLTKSREDDGALHRCGSLMIAVVFGNSYPRGLLETVTTSMSNVSLAAESSLSAGRKLMEAERTYAQSRLEGAKKLKPDL